MIMRKHLLMALLLPALLAMSADAITMKAVASPQIAPNTVEPGVPFTVDVFINNTEVERFSHSLPLVFFSPDNSITQITHYDAGAMGSTGSIELLNIFDATTYGSSFTEIFEFSWDGNLPDTVNHTALAGFSTTGEWSNDLGNQVNIRFHIVIDQTGTFCIDSAHHPEHKYDWLFEAPSPSFHGPYCWYVSNYYVKDYDGDGVADSIDNCPTTFNPGQEDGNGDDIGDACTFSAETPAGSDVEVALSHEIMMSFASVSSQGTTEMTLTGDNPTPPPSTLDLMPIRIPEYVEATTTATFDDLIEVCITYDDYGLSPEDELALVLLHYNGSEWEDITTSVDTNTNVLCGEATSLSPFVHGLPNCCKDWGLPGDADNSGYVDLLDILLVIDYLYTEPTGQPHNPGGCDALLDANGDGTWSNEPIINLLDILQLIAHVYVPDEQHYGDPPNCCPPDCMEQ